MKVLLDLDGMYPTPVCDTCGDTERVYVLDEDESRLIAVLGVGKCLGCAALIVDHTNAAGVVEERE